LQECDLVELVNGCRENVLLAHKDAEIAIEEEDSQNYFVTGDPHLLELALMNLLENAAKYSQGPAKIVVRLAEREGALRLTVADQGIGIPKENIDHIFDRFYRVDKVRSRRVGGSGLGLSIVQTIIDKHFGTISVESQLGQGTIFTLLLPTACWRLDGHTSSCGGD
jgi:two-component system phosphate regulon sensor histidine kinase PhoR